MPLISLLRWSLIVLGATAIAIAGSNFVVGVERACEFWEWLLRTALNISEPLTGLRGRDVDNEFRFYSVLWFAFGVLAIQAGLALPSSLGRTRVLLIVFLAGGIGRALSVMAVGPPHPLFVILMWIEIIMSVSLLGACFAVARQTSTMGKDPSGNID